jgi:hypothetical protein
MKEEGERVGMEWIGLTWILFQEIKLFVKSLMDL